MNRKQFLKTGILGMIVGLFNPKLLAKSNEINNNLYSNKFTLRTSAAITNKTSFPKDIEFFDFELDGNLEEILQKQKRQTLMVFARYNEDYGNKNDACQELKRLLEIYK